MKGAAGGTSEKPRQQHTSLVPVTLRQIQMAEHDPNEDKLIIDGREVTQVRIVGQVLELTNATQGSNCTFNLDDGTANCEVRVWMHSAEGSDAIDYNAETKANWRTGVYLEVFGSIKVLKDKRSIIAQRVQIVSDYNLITHHFLQCVFVHLYTTKGVGGHGVVTGMAKFDPYSVGTSIKPEQTNPYNNSAMSISAAGSDIETAITAMCAQGPPKGLHFDYIAGKLPQFSRDEVESTIQTLLDRAAIYTTIENHYKA